MNLNNTPGEKIKYLPLQQGMASLFMHVCMNQKLGPKTMLLLFLYMVPDICKMYIMDGVITTHVNTCLITY